MTTSSQQFPEPQAEDLTPEQRERWADQSHQATEAFRAAIRGGHMAAWQMAEAAYRCYELKAWYGVGLDTQSEWLADPEITWTKRQFHRYVRAWKVLRLTHAIDDQHLNRLGMSKVEIVLPVLEAGARPVDEVLDDVEGMGARDLRETYWGPRKPQEDAEDDQPPSNGQGPQAPVVDDSGPVRASDGAPVDALLEADNGSAWDKQLDPESETPAEREWVWIDRAGAWSLEAVNSLERIEPPPTNK